MSEALYRATQDVSEEDLPDMVLAREELPDELRDFLPVREGVLDNETMAEHGFPGTTTEETRATGRITGYLREFASPNQTSGGGASGLLRAGSNVIAATVVHLFHDGQQVSRWMNGRFLGEFQRFVGRELEEGQQIISADPLQFEGFSDEAVGLRTLQTSQVGLISSTIVDFRVGRLLGVAYLVTLGDAERTQTASGLGLELERRMIRVVLSSN